MTTRRSSDESHDRFLAMEIAAMPIAEINIKMLLFIEINTKICKI